MKKMAHYGSALLALAWLAACGGGDPAMDGGVDGSSSMDSAMADGATGDGATGDGAMSDAAMDAPAPEACAMEGATRVADCGMCGSRSETCTAGVWVGASECLGQGECAVGAVDEQTTAMCVTQQRLCGATCAWGAWEDVSTGGECEPGAVQVVPRAGCTNQIVERCADTCTWQPQYAEGCGPCGAPPRTDLDLLCIPTNDVLLNRTVDPTSETFPATVSYFWIMRYPVTQAMERDCVNAGDCTMAGVSPGDDIIAASSADGGRAYDYQEELCGSLGGRSPRLAEWVLAARGPAPRASRYPWWNGLSDAGSNDHRGCDTAPLSSEATSCPGRFWSLTALPTVDGLPWTRSYFGVEGMIGSPTAEVVSDGFEAELTTNYDRSLTPALHDPTGPGGFHGTLVGGGLLDDAGGSYRSPSSSTGMIFGDYRCVFEVTP